VLTEKVLVEGVLLTGSTVAYYTTSSKARTVIVTATVCNTTGADINLTLYLTPPGIAPAPANAIFWSMAVASGKSIVLYQLTNHVLEPSGATIQASGLGLSFRVSGYERPA
jgi:hypothetical protein